MKVYLIDDCPTTLVILSNMLVTAGFSVLYSLPSDPKLCKRVEEFSPDVILLDLYMPTKSGLVVSEEIRSIPSLLETPLVAISSSKSFEDKVKVMNKSFIDYLEKPLERVSFIEKVTRYARLGHLINRCQNLARTLN